MKWTKPHHLFCTFDRFGNHVLSLSQEKKMKMCFHHFFSKKEKEPEPEGWTTQNKICLRTAEWNSIEKCKIWSQEEVCGLGTEQHIFSSFSLIAEWEARRSWPTENDFKQKHPEVYPRRERWTSWTVGWDSIDSPKHLLRCFLWF